MSLRGDVIALYDIITDGAKINNITSVFLFHAYQAMDSVLLILHVRQLKSWRTRHSCHAMRIFYNLFYFKISIDGWDRTRDFYDTKLVRCPLDPG